MNLNRRGFLRAVLATAALPVIDLVPVPVLARMPPVTSFEQARADAFARLTIFDRALSDDEMAALCRGHGLLSAVDQWGIPAHSWIIPEDRLRVRWGTVVGSGVLTAVADPQVEINGRVQFSKTDHGVTVIHGLMCSCPHKFAGHVYRPLNAPIHMLCGDTLHIEILWKDIA